MIDDLDVGGWHGYQVIIFSCKTYDWIIWNQILILDLYRINSYDVLEKFMLIESWYVIRWWNLMFWYCMDPLKLVIELSLNCFDGAL